MIDIKILDLVAQKELVKFLALYWNGDIVIHLSDPTKGENQEQFDRWQKFCALHEKDTIEGVSIGDHEFNEDRFEFSCDVSPMIRKKEEGKIQIVLTPRNGKALDMEIENLEIPKEFVKVIKFRENQIQIRLEQPNANSDHHKKLVNLISLTEFHENKIIDKVRLGSHWFKNQKFRFTSKPKLGIELVKPGKLEIILQTMKM